MPHFRHLSLPPVSAECESTLHLAQPGAGPTQLASKLFRSSDGKMRVDCGDTSVILGWAPQRAVVLDHLQKEARIFPMPEEPQLHLGLGGFQAPPPPAPPMNPQELGGNLIDGQAVEGKLFSFQPPMVPKLPALSKAFAPPQIRIPKLPELPSVPSLPKVPDLAKPELPAGGIPEPPLPVEAKLPHAVEVWTSKKLHLPVLSKVTGGFGQHTASFKNATPGEPAAALFEIPPNYKLVHVPKPPPLPRLPGEVATGLPDLPQGLTEQTQKE